MPTIWNGVSIPHPKLKAIRRYLLAGDDITRERGCFITVSGDIIPFDNIAPNPRVRIIAPDEVLAVIIMGNGPGKPHLYAVHGTVDIMGTILNQ